MTLRSARRERVCEQELSPNSRFLEWFGAVEKRHLAELKFPEIRRGVQALSESYVETRMKRLDSVLTGRGKRAAFAMFYAPLHYLILEAIVVGLGIDRYPVEQILDLGCGTGVGGAVWALHTPGCALVEGIDRNAWAAAEARWNWHTLGVGGTVRQDDLCRARLPGNGSGIVLAFTANELDHRERSALSRRLIGAASRGAQVLVVEPTARRIAPWWPDWQAQFAFHGGIANEWRIRASLPERLRLMDRAAGLDHRELTARSLYLPGRQSEPEAVINGC